MAARNVLWIVPAFVLVAVFVYYPIVSNFYLSTFKWSAFAPTPVFVGLENYQRAMGDPVFWHALLNNIGYAIVSLIVQVFLAMVLAAMLERFVGRRLSGFLRVVYFIPATISTTVAGILFTFMYDPHIGLVDGFLGAIGLQGLEHAWLGEQSTAIWSVMVMSQWMSFGYTTMLFVVAIQKVPRELYEAAEIDGVGPIRAFFAVTVPLVREMTTLMTILTISGAFLVFNEVQVMTGGGPDNSSQVLGTWLYFNAFQADRMGYAAAIASIIFVITFGAGLVQVIRASRNRVEL
jgi:raffinose/stachyose/melibiose transport system permease protein